jgi:hypothetical protein
MTWPSWLSNFFDSVGHGVAAIGASVAAVLSWINRKKIQEVHLTMNSRLDRLLRVTEQRAHEEGRREGVEAEQQRMRPADPSPPSLPSPPEQK